MLKPIDGEAAVPGRMSTTFPNVAVFVSLNKSADCVDVVKLEGLDVPMYIEPIIDLNVHGEFVDDPSVSASCGAVELESVRVKRGEVVPIPTTAFTRLV